MRLCLVGKYPPIEGGVSMHTYWTAYGLAERGHQVHVVTNAQEVEVPFRMDLDADDERWYEPRFASGGAVTVWSPEPLSMPRMGHIPVANPFVTKLASVATQVIRHHHCQAVLAYYFEPYAVAAHLACTWTERPLAVMHAGSDLERLMRLPDLATAYQEVLKEAAAVVTGEPLVPRFMGLGVRADRLQEPPPFAVRTDVFHPEAPALDPDAVGRAAEGAVPHVSAPVRPFDPGRPTIGVYGKLGVTKGSFDLVAALGLLKRDGLAFNLLAMTHGWQEGEFGASISAAGLDEDTWRLPFLPSWRVPGFVRACTAVCFLERGFPIAIHGPTIPREVLACGTCLVVSGEIADKNRHPSPLRHGHDALVVADPRDHAELATCLRLVVERPETAAGIGRRGHERSQASEDVGRFVNGFEALFARLSTPSPASPGAEGRAGRVGPDVEGVVRRLLPRSSALVGPGLEDLVARFRATLEVGEEDELGVAARFAEHLAEDIESLGLDEPDLARSVVAYERARLWALTDDPSDTRPAFASPDRLGGRPVASRDGLDGLRPLRSSRLRIERFDHDVEALLRGSRPERRATLVCFHRSPNRGRTAVRINGATRDLLLRCDGTRTAREIAADLTGSGTDRAAGEDRTLSRTVQALHRLYDAGLIVFVSGPPRAGR